MYQRRQCWSSSECETSKECGWSQIFPRSCTVLCQILHRKLSLSDSWLEKTNDWYGKKLNNSLLRSSSISTQAETLAYFNNDCKTRIVADAGPTGISAVLTQFQDGAWRVISCASRNLTDVKRRYSQMEKEALALVWACERFNLYVYGHDFELETDHKPLECIYKSTSKPSARIERWVLSLQSYSFQVVTVREKLTSRTPCHDLTPRPKGH